MNKDRRKYLADIVLTYLVINSKPVQLEEMLKELSKYAKGEEELEYIENILKIETSCKTRYCVLSNNFIAKRSNIPESCALCPYSSVKYKKAEDEKVKADIICEKSEQMTYSGVDYDELFLQEPLSWCPILKGNK